MNKKAQKIIFFLVFLPISTAYIQSSPEQEQYNLYPQYLERGELPGNPSELFLRTITRIQTFPEQCPNGRFWVHEYHPVRKQQILRSLFISGSKVTVYTHKHYQE